MGPADPLPSHRAIENLIAAYAELVDGGDFAGVGGLLAGCTFAGRWRFVERRVSTDLVGDVSRHLRRGGAGA